MYGLRIKVDFETGFRAGGIDPCDPGLVSHPSWQDLEGGEEVRVIIDDRDPAVYAGIPGVTVLKGEVEIDAAIRELSAKAEPSAARVAAAERYEIRREALMLESIRQKGIDISDLTPDMPEEELARALYQRGALGIAKVTAATRQPPRKAKDIVEKHRARILAQRAQQRARQQG